MAGEPVFDGETIADLDVDKVAEGATKLKYLNNAVRENITCLQTSFKVEHYNDTGKHTKKFFHETVTLTAAAATTAVNIVPDTDVTDDRKLYVVGFMAYVGGAVAWAGGSFTNVSIQGTDAVEFVRLKSSGLGANDILIMPTKIGDENDGSVGSTSHLNFNNTSPLLKGVGGTANKGLQVKADALPTTGSPSDLYITVWGFIY